MTPTAADVAEYEAWVASRPPAVREVASRLNPWTLYTLKPTGQRVFVVSFSEGEDGGPVTLKVGVSREHNPDALFDRVVFGIAPEDLAPSGEP